MLSMNWIGVRGIRSVGEDDLNWTTGDAMLAIECFTVLWSEDVE